MFLGENVSYASLRVGEMLRERYNWTCLRDIIEWVADNAPILKCVGCSLPLSAAGWVLRWYPHPDGLKLEDFDEPMWVYVECAKCGYGNALWKLIRQVEAER